MDNPQTADATGRVGWKPNHKPAPERPALYWGQRAADFYRGLANKPVQISLVGDKIVTGELVGHDQYELLIKQPGGAVIMMRSVARVPAIKELKAEIPRAGPARPCLAI